MNAFSIRYCVYIVQCFHLMVKRTSTEKWETSRRVVPSPSFSLSLQSVFENRNEKRRVWRVAFLHMHVCGTQGLERMEEVSASSVSEGSREQVMEAVVVVLVVGASASALASASGSVSVSVADHSHVHAARSAVSLTTRSAIIQVARTIARLNLIYMYISVSSREFLGKIVLYFITIIYSIKPIFS